MIATLPLAKAAARSAYYATFHAAEALIVERTEKIAKTHTGVRSEFARLLKHDGSARDLLPILALGYRYKEFGDYGLGATAHVTAEDATKMIEATSGFVARIAALLSTSPLA